MLLLDRDVLLKILHKPILPFLQRVVDEVLVDLLVVCNLWTVILDVFEEEIDFFLVSLEGCELVHFQSLFNHGKLFVDDVHAIVVALLVVKLLQILFVLLDDFVEFLSEGEVLLVVFVTDLVFVENLQNDLLHLLTKLLELFGAEGDLVVDNLNLVVELFKRNLKSFFVLEFANILPA